MAKKASTGGWKLLLILSPIPLAWLLFSLSPWFDDYFRPLENYAMNWRFRVRGPVETSEVKLIYANIDAATISEFGERPWPRAIYASLVKDLYEVAGAKVIGIDLVLSPAYYSGVVSREAVRANDAMMARVIDEYPMTVLAANYSLANMPMTLEERAKNRALEAVEVRQRFFPYRYLDLAGRETFPEMPTAPMIGFEHIDRGQVGFIDWDSDYNKDPSPRIIPLYADSFGTAMSLDFLDGILKHFDIPIRNFGELPEGTSEEDEARFNTFFNEGFYFYSDFTGQLSIFGPNMQQVATHTVEERDHRFYAFSLEMALKYLGLTHEQVEVTKNYLTVKDDTGKVRIRAPLIEEQMIEINWFSPWHDTDAGFDLKNRYNPQASVAKITQQLYNYHEGEGEVKAEAVEYLKQFEGAMVMIAPTGALLQDLAPSPFDDNEVPKAGLHGNAIKTLLTGQYITRLGDWATVLSVLLLTPAVAWLGMYTGRRSLYAKAASIVLTVAYVALVFAVFSFTHTVVPLIAPVGAASTTVTVGVLYQLLVEEKRRSRIKNMFGAYLSPVLVNRMTESGEEPALGGESTEITAFFSDIQGFSTFSEQLTPEQLVQLMNEYLGAMTDILEAESGTLDKYIGDAIVALFNAPISIEQHAYHGCRAAALMQTRQAELREKWAAEGDKWPPIVPMMRTRIGLNTGEATVGNMGSEKRFNYTMMGDTVNLAARCESGAKSFGVYTMITKETYDHASAAGNGCIFRYIDKIIVKGRTKPAEMYEVVGLKEDVPDSGLECIDFYSKGIDFYSEQRFDEALAMFEKALLLEPFQVERDPGVTLNPSLMMINRCHQYKVDPPGEGWDGVFRMTSK